jgi:hypothetical protein
MSENQTHLDPSPSDTSHEPASADQVASEDPGIVYAGTPAVDPAVEQNTVVLPGAEHRRRSLRDRAHNLISGHTDDPRTQDAPRSWGGARAITTVVLCLLSAFSGVVIASRSEQTHTPRSHPAGSAHRTRARQTEPPERHSRPTGLVVTTLPRHLSTRDHPPRYQPAPTKVKVMRSSAASEPATPPSPAQAPEGGTPAQYGGGPFSP